jgi:hypothetical protein
VACGGCLNACLGSAAAGNTSFLSEEATRTLAVIVVMLRTSPQRRRKATANSSSSGQPLNTVTSGAQYRPSAHTSAGPIANAYGKFLELPVPVVLGVLWLIGAVLLGLLLGVVLVAAYWAEVWPPTAMSLLL